MSRNSPEEVPKNPIYDVLPLLLCALSIPLSMFFWLGNLAFSKFLHNPEYDDNNVIYPMRWLFSIMVPSLLMIVGYKRKGVNESGAITGFIMAVILSIASHPFLACLAAFFFSSTYATKYGSKQKRKLEEDFKEGGQRNWAQALCNAGMPTQLALLYLLDCGSGEKPIDFRNFFRSSWLGIGVLSSFACANGDTWASELGTVFSKGDPFLITNRKRVPKGTNGGISIPGLIVSWLGGLLIGFTYYLTLVYTVDALMFERSAPQWPIIIIGGIAGLFGSLVDSLLGATLQYSGINEEGKIVERPGKHVKHISGRQFLDNHSVNLISSIITGVSMPWVAQKVWLLFF